MAPLPPFDDRHERYRSLFDSDWYLSRYPEVKGQKGDVFSHYVKSGRCSGYAPNPFFDPAWYSSRYPEVPRADLDPFWHYIIRGERLGHQPNPLFHTEWYALQQGLSAEDSPLAHFVKQPSTENPAPNPLFDSAWYLEANAAVLKAGENPLSHYLEKGYLFCRPHPLFDSAWYLDRYREVAASGTNPLAHFLGAGWVSGYQPNPFFDTNWYCEQYLKEKPEAQNPLLHFVEVGAAKGYRPHPLFDPSWYLGRYPSVARSGANPLAHYLQNRGSPADAESEWEPNALSNSAWLRTEHIELLPSKQTLHHQGRPQWQGAFRPGPHFEHFAKFFSSYSDGFCIHDREDNPLRDYFSAEYIDSVVSSSEASFDEISDPEVTIIIPAFNQFSHTMACLRSVATARTRCRFEVLLADDASDAVDFAEELKAVHGLRVSRSKCNQGFLETCNATAREARGQFLVFLNNDTVVLDDWLDELLATPLRFADTGLVGSKLLFPNGRIAEAGCIVWKDAVAWNYGRRLADHDVEADYAREVDYVSAASLLVERSFFSQLGGFDPAYRPAYYEDTDLAFRTRKAGRRVLYQPASRVIHFEGVSSPRNAENPMKKSQLTNREVFRKRWTKEISQSRPEGEELALEKDRYAPRNALFFDVGLPLRTRDARSIRLVEMMKIVRDEGYRVTFLPENLHGQEPFRTELGAHGISVVTGHSVDSPERYLEEKGEAIDLVVIARPSLAGRWLKSVRQHCPHARVLFDAIDLIDAETLKRAHEDLRTGSPNPLDSVLRRVDASLVVTEAPEKPQNSSGTQEGDAKGQQRIHRVGRIFDGVAGETDRINREGVLVVPGFDRSSAADAFAWVTDELIPRVERRLSGIHFYVQESELARTFARGAAGITLLSEHELLQTGRLERFALALLPVRFGGRLEGPIQMLLARGLPCVSTEHAAGTLSNQFLTGIQLARSTLEFEEAIAGLLEDETFHRIASRDALKGMKPLFPAEGVRREIRSAIQA